MNWVGGSRRNRLNQKYERKLQKEFFEKRRFEMRHKTGKRGEMKVTPGISLVSQDLITLSSLDKGQRSSLSHKESKHKKVDLDKALHQRNARYKHVILSCSPRETRETPSGISITDAESERQEHLTDKLAIHRRPSKVADVTSPILNQSLRRPKRQASNSKTLLELHEKWVSEDFQKTPLDHFHKIPHCGVTPRVNPERKRPMTSYTKNKQGKVKWKPKPQLQGTSKDYGHQLSLASEDSTNENALSTSTNSDDGQGIFLMTKSNLPYVKPPLSSEVVDRRKKWSDGLVKFGDSSMRGEGERIFGCGRAEVKIDMGLGRSLECCGGNRDYGPAIDDEKKMSDCRERIECGKDESNGADDSFKVVPLWWPGREMQLASCNESDVGNKRAGVSQPTENDAWEGRILHDQERNTDCNTGDENGSFISTLFARPKFVGDYSVKGHIERDFKTKSSSAALCSEQCMESLVTVDEGALEKGVGCVEKPIFTGSSCGIATKSVNSGYMSTTPEQINSLRTRSDVGGSCRASRYCTERKDHVFGEESSKTNYFGAGGSQTSNVELARATTSQKQRDGGKHHAVFKHKSEIFEKHNHRNMKKLKRDKNTIEHYGKFQKMARLPESDNHNSSSSSLKMSKASQVFSRMSNSDGNFLEMDYRGNKDKGTVTQNVSFTTCHASSSTSLHHSHDEVARCFSVMDSYDSTNIESRPLNIPHTCSGRQLIIEAMNESKETDRDRRLHAEKEHTLPGTKHLERNQNMRTQIFDVLEEAKGEAVNDSVHATDNFMKCKNQIFVSSPNEIVTPGNHKLARVLETNPACSEISQEGSICDINHFHHLFRDFKLNPNTMPLTNCIMATTPHSEPRCKPTISTPPYTPHVSPYRATHSCPIGAHRYLKRHHISKDNVEDDFNGALYQGQIPRARHPNGDRLDPDASDAGTVAIDASCQFSHEEPHDIPSAQTTGTFKIPDTLTKRQEILRQNKEMPQEHVPVDTKMSTSCYDTNSHRNTQTPKEAIVSRTLPQYLKKIPFRKHCMDFLVTFDSYKISLSDVLNVEQGSDTTPGGSQLQIDDQMPLVSLKSFTSQSKNDEMQEVFDEVIELDETLSEGAHRDAVDSSEETQHVNYIREVLYENVNWENESQNCIDDGGRMEEFSGSFGALVDRDSSGVMLSGAVGVHGTIVGGHVTVTGGHETMIGGHETMIGGHETMIGGHETMIGGHETMIGGHETMIGGHETVTGDHETMTGGHETVTGDHETMTGGHETVTGDHETVTGDHETVTGDHETMTGGHETVTGDHETVTGDHETVTGDHETMTGGHETVTGGHETMTGGHETMTGDHETMTGGHETVTGDHETMTGGHETVTGDHETMTGGHETVTGDHETVTGDHETMTGHHETVTGHHETVMGHHETVTGHHGTVTGHHGKVTGHHETVTGHHETVTGGHETASSVQETVTYVHETNRDDDKTVVGVDETVKGDIQKDTNSKNGLSGIADVDHDESREKDRNDSLSEVRDSGEKKGVCSAVINKCQSDLSCDVCCHCTQNHSQFYQESCLGGVNRGKKDENDREGHEFERGAYRDDLGNYASVTRGWDSRTDVSVARSVGERINDRPSVGTVYEDVAVQVTVRTHDVALSPLYRHES